MHQIFAKAVDDISAEFSGKINLIMAGPATAGLSFFWNPSHGLPTLEEDFLDQILKPYSTNCSSSNPTCNGQFNSRLDRYSFHFYGSAEPTVTLETITGTIRNKLQSLGRSDVKLFVSEWGPSTIETTDVNYSHKGAAWAAAFLPRAVAAKVEMGSYLLLEDGLTSTPSGGDPYVRGGASLLAKVVASDRSVHYYPKPAANVFKMFAMMTGTRRPATVSATAGGSTNLGAFVASDAKSAHVVVYNYSPTLVFQNSNNSDSPENFSVELDKLPFNGTVTVNRYLVDANTSNFAAFLSQPSHPAPTLQMVEQFTAHVQNGKVKLPSRTLGLGVTYLRIHP